MFTAIQGNDDVTVIRPARRQSILVLLATRNGAAWIDEQCDSIALQEGAPDVSVAVCDDGSSDDTLQRLERRAARFGRPLTVVHSALPGGSAGRNFFRLMLGVDADGHDFVALSDQDDVWLPHKLRHAVERLTATGAAGYSAAVEAVWPDGRSVVLAQVPHSTGGDHLFEGAGQGCSFVLTGALFRQLQRDLRRGASQLHHIHYHDWALYALTRRHGHAWVFDERPCLRYRQHAANDTGARGRLAGVARRLRLIRSGWYGRQVTAIARLCASVPASTESSTTAEAYLQLADRWAEGHWDRWRLLPWLWRHGRRRWLDRCLLLWALLAGHLVVRGNRPR